MKSNTMRVVGGIAVIAVAIVLLIVLKDDGKSASESSDVGAGNTPAESGQAQGEPAVPVIVVRDGEPVGGVRELIYEEGDRIHFKVKSNRGDEVHVHGYDVEKEVEAGGSVVFDFPATIEGGFEAEMHHGGQIAELTVNP